MTLPALLKAGTKDLQVIGRQVEQDAQDRGFQRVRDGLYVRSVASASQVFQSHAKGATEFSPDAVVFGTVDTGELKHLYEFLDMRYGGYSAKQARRNSAASGAMFGFVGVAALNIVAWIVAQYLLHHYGEMHLAYEPVINLATVVLFSMPFTTCLIAPVIGAIIGGARGSAAYDARRNKYAAAYEARLSTGAEAISRFLKSPGSRPKAEAHQSPRAQKGR